MPATRPADVGLVAAMLTAAGLPVVEVIGKPGGYDAVLPTLLDAWRTAALVVTDMGQPPACWGSVTVHAGTGEWAGLTVCRVQRTTPSGTPRRQ